MKKLKLYLETSIWNFYYADDAPEKKRITRQFFNQLELGVYETYISGIVYREIANAAREKRILLTKLIEEFQPTELDITEEAERMAELYLEEQVLPKRAFEDARHAAIAAVNEMDALISWNLRHLANLKRMEQVNGVNRMQGYAKRLELITPMEVSNE